MIRKISGILLFFLSGLLLATYFGGNIPVIYLLMWIMVSGIAVLYYYLLPSSLPCSLEIPSSCAKGEKVTGYLHINHDGILPIFCGKATINLRSLYYRQEETITLDITLMGREEGIAAFDLELPYTGMLEITLQKAEIYGIFGLGKKTILSSLKKSLTVMPDIREIAIDFPPLDKVDPEGEKLRDNSRGYDPGSYQGIRPYTQGDSMKNIHWKLTGKTEELMVKELGLPSGREARLYLETGLQNLHPSAIDCLIEDYFSLSVELIHQGYPHILCWNNSKGNLEEYRTDSMEMLEMAMEPLFHIKFWKSSENTDTKIYYMSHDRKYTYGFYHDDAGDYLAPAAIQKRLWKEGG